MRGEIDFIESFQRRVGLLKGMDESVLQRWSARLRLTEGAEKLISTLPGEWATKRPFCLGGSTYFANDLKQRLGINYVYANELEIENGKVTGQVTGQVVDGARKAQLLNEIAGRKGFAGADHCRWGWRQ